MKSPANLQGFFLCSLESIFDTVECFQGKMSEINLECRETTADILGYTGCSGAPLLIKNGKDMHLWGVLFYALKDDNGKGELCKAVDLNSLIENCDFILAPNNTYATY